MVTTVQPSRAPLPPLRSPLSTVAVERGNLSPLVLADEAAEDRTTLDPPPREVGNRVVGAGRAQLAAAMGPPSVPPSYDGVSRAEGWQ
jgi:hypothetical protein